MINRFKSKFALISIICWALYVTYAIGMSYLSFPTNFHFTDLLIGHTMAIGLFYYFSLLVIPAFSNSKKIVAGILYMLISFFLFCFFRYLSKGVKDIDILFRPTASFFKVPFINYCIFVFFEYFIYALGYWFAMDGIKKAKNIKLLEQQKTEIENQFLKEQLSPHFLYNTLSYFYTKTLAYNPELADGIITLTEILRYTLKTDTEKVFLSLETDHIENLIKINNIRFSNRLNIIFIKEYDHEHRLEIVPHSLITLVENAFKYGDLLDQDNPVRFTLKADPSGIFFSVNNKKNIVPKIESNGTGLNNLRRRLDFLYRNNYSLNIKDEHKWYNVELYIKG